MREQLGHLGTDLLLLFHALHFVPPKVAADALVLLELLAKGFRRLELAMRWQSGRFDRVLSCSAKGAASSQQAEQKGSLPHPSLSGQPSAARHDLITRHTTAGQN